MGDRYGWSSSAMRAGCMWRSDCRQRGSNCQLLRTAGLDSVNSLLPSPQTASAASVVGCKGRPPRFLFVSRNERGAPNYGADSIVAASWWKLLFGPGVGDGGHGVLRLRVTAFQALMLRSA